LASAVNGVRVYEEHVIAEVNRANKACSRAAVDIEELGVDG